MVLLTFDQCNGSLLNKSRSIHFLLTPNSLNGCVYLVHIIINDQVTICNRPLMKTISFRCAVIVGFI